MMPLRAIAGGVLLAAAVLAAGKPAWAAEIETVRTTSGHQAWLMRVPGAPLVSLRFAFTAGGSMADPTGQEGRASLLAGMLVEGAGTMPGAAFKERLSSLSARLTFDAARDALSGSLDVPAAAFEEAAGLLALALQAPRLDTDALDRVKRRRLADIAAASKDAGTLADDALYAALYAGHPYARPPSGTAAGIAAIGPDDIRSALARMRQGAAQIVAVGDLAPAGLAAMIDKAFMRGAASAEVAPAGGATVSASAQSASLVRDLDETTVVFALPGPARRDGLFAPTLVLNHILGGATLNSRLASELRGRRGLVYGIETRLVADRHAALWTGQLACEPARCATARRVLLDELRAIVRDGPSADEVEQARDYLIGSFALSFASNRAIADNLIGLALGGYAPEYVSERGAILAGVTTADVHAAARALLLVREPLFVEVGPAGAAQ